MVEETNPIKGGKIAIVGAGPVGLVLSILLSEKGFHVDLFEKRTLADFQSPPDRVLGTTLTQRGQVALKAAGLTDENFGIRLLSMQVHLPRSSGDYTFLIGRQGDLFYSLSRSELLHLLLAKTEKLGTKLHWGSSVKGVDPESGKLVWEQDGEEKENQYEAIFGADGVYSSIRRHLEELKKVTSTIETCELGYLYMYIPPKD